MSERLVHQRTKGPASTPAQRLVELQNALSDTERRLIETQAEVTRLQRDYDRYHQMGGQSFGGIKMAQIPADTLLWEAVLNSNPQLRAIFEIGTWQGGFSWWLWAQTQVRSMYFRTYDSIVPEQKPPNFMRQDVFADVAYLGEKFRSYEPCVVFCDGGNKPRELKTYAAELRSPESLFLVHDWGTESGPDDVPDSLEMIYPGFCEELGSITRVFRLREENT